LYCQGLRCIFLPIAFACLAITASFSFHATVCLHPQINHEIKFIRMKKLSLLSAASFIFITMVNAQINDAGANNDQHPGKKRK
jgi:hypothetical protein